MECVRAEQAADHDGAALELVEPVLLARGRPAGEQVLLPGVGGRLVHPVLPALGLRVQRFHGELPEVAVRGVVREPELREREGVLRPEDLPELRGRRRAEGEGLPGEQRVHLLDPVPDLQGLRREAGDLQVRPHGDPSRPADQGEPAALLGRIRDDSAADRNLADSASRADAELLDGRVCAAVVVELGAYLDGGERRRADHLHRVPGHLVLRGEEADQLLSARDPAPLPGDGPNPEPAAGERPRGDHREAEEHLPEVQPELLGSEVQVRSVVRVSDLFGAGEVRLLRGDAVHHYPAPAVLHQQRPGSVHARARQHRDLHPLQQLDLELDDRAGVHQEKQQGAEEAVYVPHQPAVRSVADHPVRRSLEGALADHALLRHDCPVRKIQGHDS